MSTSPRKTSVNTRCRPWLGRCQETLSSRQEKRQSTPYFTGYSQTCAIFFEKWSCVTFLLPSVSKKHYNREWWDLRCPMLPLLLEKGDFYLPNQWNHGKVPDYKSGSPTAVARGLGNLTWPYYLIYGGSRCLFNRNSGVWDNSNSMKAVCLQHDALPWEVVIMNFDEDFDPNQNEDYDRLHSIAPSIRCQVRIACIWQLPPLLSKDKLLPENKWQSIKMHHCLSWWVCRRQKIYIFAVKIWPAIVKIIFTIWGLDPRRWVGLGKRGAGCYKPWLLHGQGFNTADIS